MSVFDNPSPDYQQQKPQQYFYPTTSNMGMNANIANQTQSKAFKLIQIPHEILQIFL